MIIIKKKEDKKLFLRQLSVKVLLLTSSFCGNFV